MRRYVPLLIAGLALFLLGALTGRTAVAADPCGGGDPVAPPGQARHAYVLQQVDSPSQLANIYGPQIDAAKRNVPALNGLSVREGWAQYDADKSVLDVGRAIAARNGLDFVFRPMAGRWTPAAVLDEMDRDTPGYTYVAGSSRIPKPFGSDGTPGNPVFEKYFRALVSELLTDAETHGGTLVHLPWYGEQWAELNNAAQVRATAGYSPDAWLEGHKRLIDIAADEQSKHPTVAVEFPFSGSGPLPQYTVGTGSYAGRGLSDYLVEKFGADTTLVYFQANGWNWNGEWGAPDATVEAQHDGNFAKPVKRMLQAIQPYPQMAPTAGQVDTMLANATAVGADAFELYLPTYTNAASYPLWKDRIATWVAG